MDKKLTDCFNPVRYSFNYSKKNPKYLYRINYTIPMKNKFLKLSLALVMPLIASAKTDWTPTFKDAPVTKEEVKVIAAAMPTSPIVKPKAKRKVLIYSATAGFRHKSIPYGKIALRLMGKKTGAFETVISDNPANFEPAALEKFDAVILLNTTQDFFMPSSKTQRDEFSDKEWAALQKRNDRLVDNLVDYVTNGGGLAGIHAATDSCYNHKEYGDTIGGYFWGHPWTAKTNVTIVVEDPEHKIIKPVFEGMKDFRLQEEIYQFQEEPYSRDRLRVLLHLDPDRSDKVDPEKVKRTDGDFAVAWVQKVGKGRVFYTSIGHNNHIFSNPLMLKHYLAGIQFAMGDLKADTTPSSKRK